MTKRKKKILAIVALCIVSVVFILPLIGFSILNWGILPPKKLTPLVVEQTNKFIDAHFECERIELTYFETYPYLGVKLINGHLTHQMPDSISKDHLLDIPADSLFSFQQAKLSVQPFDFLFKKRITIKDLSISSPRFYGFVSSDGHPNWDIYLTKETDEETENEETDKESDLPVIDLQRVRIYNGKFTYDDRQSDVFAEVGGFFLTIDGSLTGNENRLSIDAGTSSILFDCPDYRLKNNVSLQLKSKVLLTDQYQSVTLQDAELRINQFPFTASGSLRKIPESNLSHVDLEMDLKIGNLNDLLDFVPDAYLKDRNQMVTKGEISLNSTITGLVGDSIMPSINLCCKINNGSYHMKGVKQGIDTLQMDLDLHLNGRNPDSSYVELQDFTLIGLNTALSMNGYVYNLYTNPQIYAVMRGNMDFTRLGEEFFNPDTLLIEGLLQADLMAHFKLDDLLDSQFGKIKAAGSLSVDQLKAECKPLELDLFIGGTQLAIDPVRQESNYLGKNDLVRLVLDVDTLNVQYKTEINSTVSKLSLHAQTSPTIDTTAVIPMTAGISFSHLQTQLPDSILLIAEQLNLQAAIKPSLSDKHKPTAGGRIAVDTLKFISKPMRSGAVLAKSNFNFEALPYTDARRERQVMQAAGDSLQTRRQKRRMAADSLHLSDQAAGENLIQQLFSQWEARGNVSFNKLQAFSQFFPIPIWMDPTTLTFNTNTVKLTDANLHLGNSNLKLSGQLNRIRQAFLRGGKLRGEFELTSDYIDCTQLMQSVNAGMQYADNTVIKAIEEPVAILDAQSLNEVVAIIEADTTDQVFVVPDFLDLSLNTNAKRIDFNELQLENVTGEIVIRNQSINLNKLNMQSNMGSGNLTMNYTAKNKDGASTGLDLDLNRIQIGELVSLFPAIDTLVPMLRSFEGVVNCEITATCKLDSSMSVILPSVNAACYLHGENMVLLDGETFAEISKMMMFKNKKRNVIDSIAVDLAIKDNQIEVFPFQVEMDRYRVAVGGTHNLDMTFNYHISVLKSPVPFKLGVDVYGNLDKFKFKITKAKYKDLFKPAKMAEMDSTRKNIRKDIRDAVRQQIRQTAPELKQ